MGISTYVIKTNKEPNAWYLEEADEVIDQQEIKNFQLVYRKLKQKDISANEVRSKIAAAELEDRGVESFLPQQARRLTTEQKEFLVRAALFIATANGKLQSEEKALLKSIGKSLELSPAHLLGIIQSFQY
jgi:tellurite resistance protein